MKVGKDTLGKIRANIASLLETYIDEINMALDDNDGIDISLPVKIRQGGSKLDVQVGISFVKTKVKDSVVFAISDQKELFLDEAAGNPLKEVMFRDT